MNTVPQNAKSTLKRGILYHPAEHSNYVETCRQGRVFIHSRHALIKTSFAYSWSVPVFAGMFCLSQLGGQFAYFYWLIQCSRFLIGESVVKTVVKAVTCHTDAKSILFIKFMSVNADSQLVTMVFPAWVNRSVTLDSPHKTREETRPHFRSFTDRRRAVNRVLASPLVV